MACISEKWSPEENQFIPMAAFFGEVVKVRLVCEVKMEAADVTP
jgi:hypothetical protein